MKRLCLYLLLLTAAVGGTSCATTKQPPTVTAPGVVYIRDSLYLDEAEVANIHWLEYLYFLQTDSSRAVYEAALPDTTLWSKHRLSLPDTVRDVFMDYYLRFPGFRYFPVVGVSQAQAEAYCRWRSAKVMENLYTSRRQRRRLRDYDVQVSYRLPTAAEWALGASGRLDPARHPYGYEHPPRQVPKRKRVDRVPQCYNPVDFPAGAAFFLTEVNVLEHLYYQTAPGQPPVYFRCDGPPRPPNPGTTMADIRPDGSVNPDAAGVEKITDYVYAYPPNGYGLYNMIGNVAELTTTPGQAKGGSFEHPMAACRPGTYQAYDGPQEWLGFRCACTIRVRRKASRTAP
ncbi:SUMF1/EgtB/PvdO family nonheme iron enzyme [Hymenobacter sp. ASUV-10]|uniref:SUMF1/EgtB/PvdO family nonheme iron enzyme n=1 Tax=Hymenobacter aranciens TaxID=3063996 RepID=A0ABT9BDN6_9BACT|nr:SUMF1/EgtB/PvdO family nonheme iron enzyme [Hymenobacter sp. ASUV-10]MDO7876365.1 SUMF1/EgtB/PvdO family nonheme iron enzyme [Hymenobacter sp. ASUV-10]